MHSRSRAALDVAYARRLTSRGRSLKFCPTAARSSLSTSDFLAACGKLYLEQSSYGNMEEWSNSPIQGLSFEKSPNDSPTSVIVRCTRSATANDLVDESAASAAAAASIVVCAQSHQAIVLTYGDDGLVSSCGSVVEL